MYIYENMYFRFIGVKTPNEIFTILLPPRPSERHHLSPSKYPVFTIFHDFRDELDEMFYILRSRPAANKLLFTHFPSLYREPT